MRRDASPGANDGVSRHLRELHERMNEMRESLQREMRELSQRHGEVGKARAEKFQRGAPVDNHKSRTSVENTQTRAACSDEQGSGELVTVNGAKQLTARDREGKVIFDGPVNTEAERAALPPAARERLERIEKSTKAEVAPAPKKEQA